MSKFFIDRPIFAWVIAIVIMLAGALSIMRLPVEQYPTLAPPSVQISANYPGASAQTVENTVTQVIEQKMNGIDNLLYMSSTSDSSGNVSITLTFKSGTDPDIAQVQVQNKLQLAMPLLPQEVQQQGVNVQKATKNVLVVVGLISEDGRYTQSDLSDLLVSKVQDPLSRTNGVGEVMVFGAQHAMRIWLDPDKLVSYKLDTSNIITAIKAENAEVSVGQLGGNPAVPGQQLNATILAQSRMQTPEEFQNILLRVNEDGSKIHLKDVARVEVGSENYEVVVRHNGKPSSGMAVKMAAGANALDTVDAVKEKMEELSAFFPPGIKVIYPYDTTPFVRLSIHEVVITLFEAILLVFGVMYLFLQNFRATLIPTIAVPVVLLGTFGVLSAFGFTINTLTMFAMVLAIGLLVDDAIVVVENVERVMGEEKLPPREATRKSMSQITGALVGIAMVLSAVFVPMAFMTGSTGAIYRQFSLTLVSAMGLSVLVALILTPALCATILRPVERGEDNWVNTGFFGWFNRNFERSRRFYLSSVRHILGNKGSYVVIYVLIFTILGVLFMRLPTSFLPDEDQGIMMAQVQTPVGATRERTKKAVDAVGAYFMTQEKENVESAFTVTGFSFAGRGQNAGMAFIKLKDWSVRNRPDQKAKAIALRAMMKLSALKDAQVYAMVPPPIIELGNATGFDLELQDQAGLGHDVLMQAKNQVLMEAWKNPALSAVRPNGLDDTPQFHIDVDRAKASALGLSLSNINATLSTAWGSSYVNDFIENGRVKKVYVQADAPYRMMPDDVDRWQVRNNQGQMIPFSTFTSSYWAYGSPQLERYNGVPSREIMGAPAPGHSSGEAMSIMEEIASHLPKGIGYEWTGISYEERLAGSQAPGLYALSVLVVFLCLAALYESWSIPFAVILIVPLGIVGSVVAVSLRGLSNDVYFQVALLTTVGLAAKNAILIVEFAKVLHDKGMPYMEAALEAARIRLRPILMTSMAFILGVFPLAIADGAGSGAQNAVGIGVTGGMVSATFLAVFFVPLFFVLIQKTFGKEGKGSSNTQDKPLHEGAKTL
ncbi:MAG: efflux RND transporter permease subunit [Alphaproteobacteria bacterium]|nr:efflux RND transporter permease subunit [Alphaproteobacteria bacterium]